MAISSSVQAGSAPGISIHPGLEQLHRGETGQPPNRVVHLARGGAPLFAGEEIIRHEAQLRARLNAAAHGCPEAVHQEPSYARGAATLEPDLGLAVVEEEVPRLVEHDALEQLGEHRMAGDR